MQNSTIGLGARGEELGRDGGDDVHGGHSFKHNHHAHPPLNREDYVRRRSCVYLSLHASKVIPDTSSPHRG